MKNVSEALSQHCKPIGDVLDEKCVYSLTSRFDVGEATLIQELSVNLSVQSISIVNLVVQSQESDDSMTRNVFFGNFFHNLSFEESTSILNGFVAVEDGKVN